MCPRCGRIFIRADGIRPYGEDVMKIIELLSNKIEEEISDAGEYAKLACEYKDLRPELANTFYNLSLEEMMHMQRLHKEVARIIEEYRKEKGEPPAGMQAIYDHEHRKQIEAAAKVKAMQALYKE
jgi:ferritin